MVLTLKVPEKLQLYGLYVYYVVHICNFGMLRVKIMDIHVCYPMHLHNTCTTHHVSFSLDEFRNLVSIATKDNLCINFFF